MKTTFREKLKQVGVILNMKLKTYTYNGKTVKARNKEEANRLFGKPLSSSDLTKIKLVRRIK